MNFNWRHISLWSNYKLWKLISFNNRYVIQLIRKIVSNSNGSGDGDGGSEAFKSIRIDFWRLNKSISNRALDKQTKVENIRVSCFENFQFHSKNIDENDLLFSK